VDAEEEIGIGKKMKVGERYIIDKKTGGTWEEINENAEKRKRKTDLKKSENMKRKLVKKVRTYRN
jgi:hypothetical protein